jgi:hypothetical protein
MRRFVGTIAVAVVLSLSIYAPQSARAVVSTAEPVVILKMANLTTFVDDSGTPVTITSDDGGGAVRTLSGTFSSGAPVSITIYSAAAATVGTTGLQKLATAAESLPPGDGQEQTVTSTAPTKPPKLTPYAAVATSKTTASVAWAPPARLQGLHCKLRRPARSDRPGRVISDKGFTYRASLHSAIDFYGRQDCCAS